MRPLCFILMPFGKRPAGDSRMVDFDAVYQQLIKPAVEAAGLEPLRADEEQLGGLIHKPMFERLVLCEYAVADLTTANANVFYELGVRHAALPRATLPIFAKDCGQLPFDVNGLRAQPYQLGADGRPANVETDRAQISARLHAAREPDTDSPVFQLLNDFPNIQRLKTDSFREQVRYAESMKAKLADARRKGASALEDIEATLGDLR
ncbi:MAG: hypothetical protein RIR00_1713, partial [Pseudomonadota bacterium]